MPSYVQFVSTEYVGRFLLLARASGFCSILLAIALGSRRSGGMGPMMPKRLRVGRKKTGMPPQTARPCSIDLWQLRSHSASSSSPTHADMIARFDADVPFN